MADTIDDKDKKTVTGAVADAVTDTVKDEKDKVTKEATNTWNQAKTTATQVYDSLAFWKKDLTEEEKLAKAKKKYAKAEKKYQKAMAKAQKEQDEEKRKQKEAKAEAKRTKTISGLTEKYPDQVAQIKANPQLIADEMAKESKWQKTWDKTKEVTSKAYNSVAFWKKAKTPEEKRAKVDKKLEKMTKKYDKAMAKAAKEQDEEKRKQKEAKALKKYEKAYNKLSKKYPDEIVAVESEIEAAAEAEEAKKEAAKKAAEDEAKRKEAAEKAKAAELAQEQAPAPRDTAAELADQARAANSPAPEDGRQEQFEERVENKAAVKAAKARVSKSPEQHKTETLTKWMNEVHLPEDTAQKMIDKYGLDVAYKLTQRCMLEPDNLMPEVDEKYKLVQNKSKTSINYFLDLDVNNNANKNVICKVTNMDFGKDDLPEPRGTNKSNRFVAEKMRQNKQQSQG